MEVNLSKSFKTVVILAGVFTFGIGAVLMILTARSWPKRVSDEGLTLRNGKTLKWSDYTNQQVVNVVDQRGRKVTSRLELIFGKNKAKIVPQSLENGYQVLDMINAKLPQSK